MADLAVDHHRHKERIHDGHSGGFGWSEDATVDAAKK